tara:strand:- start:155 stop:475 length:321 start_codon:yes stop_codon:yes gene_type:complete
MNFLCPRKAWRMLGFSYFNYMDYTRHLWKEREHMLRRSFVFPTFLSAIDFINEVATLSENHRHHPNICVDYTCVRLSLSTNDEGGIVTSKDHKLAHAIDLLYSSDS